MKVLGNSFNNAYCLLCILIFCLIGTGCTTTRQKVQQVRVVEYSLTSFEIYKEYPESDIEKIHEKSLESIADSILEGKGQAIMAITSTSDRDSLKINFESFDLELESLSKNGEPVLAPFSVTSTDDIVFQDALIDLSTGKGQIKFPVEIKSPAIEKVLEGPLDAIASVNITDITVGAVSEVGVFTSTLQFNITTQHPSFLISWLPDSKVKTTHTERWPKLGDDIRKKLKKRLKRKRFKKALDELIEELKKKGIKFDKLNGKKPKYMKGHGTGITTKTADGIDTVILDDAFTSVSLLYSTVMHELKHVNQHAKKKTPKSALRELEAWLQECENLKATGLSKDKEQKKNIREQVIKRYNQLEKKERKPFKNRVVCCLRRTKKK